MNSHIRFYYPFFTSSSKGMIEHFKKYSLWIKKRYKKNLKNIIEIGSNDGTFLNNFKKNNINLLGFEPSKNVALISKKRGIKTINKFFNYQNVKKLKNLKNKTNIIIAANAICHIPDLVSLGLFFNSNSSLFVLGLPSKVCVASLSNPIFLIKFIVGIIVRPELRKHK